MDDNKENEDRQIALVRWIKKSPPPQQQQHLYHGSRGGLKSSTDSRRHRVAKSSHPHLLCLHGSLQISSDGQRFTVSRKVADLSVTVQESIGDIDDDDNSVADGPIEVTMLNVTSEVLSLVVQYLEHYMIEEMTPITVRGCSILARRA